MNDNTSCTLIGRLVLGALLAASSSACSADELPLRNVGDTTNGLELASAVTTPVLSGNARFVGRWLGQTRDPLVRDANGQPMDYAFPSGSRQVVLELALQGDALEGSITFGDGIAPEPEAGVSYPPGVDYGLSFGDLSPSPMEGLAYRLTDETPPDPASAPADVVLSYPRFAGFTTWCPLQPSLSWAHEDFRGPGYHSCVAETDGWGGQLEEDGSRHCIAQVPGSSATQAIDCDYYALCLSRGPCACSADGCVVDGTISNHIYLDLSDGEIRAIFSDTMVEAGRLGDIRFQRIAQ